MALADKVACPPPSIHGADCSIGILLRTLPESEATALQQMLDAYGTWTARMICDTVRSEGHAIGYQSIGRHRRKACRCFQ